MTRSEMMSHEKPGDWYLIPADPEPIKTPIKLPAVELGSPTILRMKESN